MGHTESIGWTSWKTATIFQSAFPGFHEDDDGSENGNPCLYQTLNPRQRLRRVGRQCWKVSTATKTVKIHMSPTSSPWCCGSKGNTSNLTRVSLGETSLTIMPPSRTPNQEVGHDDQVTLVFVMDIKANKHQIKQAVKELCDLDWPKPVL